MPYKDLVKRKEKHRGYAKKWRTSHLEQARAADKRYSEKNKEKKRARDHKRRTTEEYRKKHREYERQWRIEHPEEAKTRMESQRVAKKAAAKRWCLKHPGEMLKLRRKGYAKTREHRNEQNRQWYEKNKEKAKVMYNAANHRRRARLNGVASEEFSLQDIIKRDGGKCKICGQPVKKNEASIDHLIPVSQNGPHLLNNVQLAHRKCNSRRGVWRLPAQLRLA